jgi:organic radical activating enzyme
MPKKQDESLVQYRDRIIDKISSSFCAAKWYNATIWLGSGTTASCHHPPAHQIPLEEVKENFKAIHNTKHKKLMRKMMLNGERPKECEYCWKMEDISKDTVSDRVFKTIIYQDDEINELAKVDYREDVDLKTLEISFDRVCNLACSYCNASFSTTWARDIKKNGAYQNLVSDGAGAFQQDGSWTEPYTSDDENPYIQAFWEWWNDSLSESLDELRITGGEPLMSGNTWKLFDWFSNQNSDMRFAINSNLIAKPDFIDSLIEKTKNINRFEIYTSCEAVGKHAEYIRDGLDYGLWKNNMVKILDEGNLRGMHVMMTINSLCLFSITDFFDEMYEIKEWFHEKTGKKQPTMSVNLVRFPSFQSPLALPDHIKIYLKTQLEDWYSKAKEQPLWHEFEKSSIERLIDYLDVVDAPHRRTSNKITLWRDFKSFYKQYDKRRGKSIYVFPKILTDWFDQLPDTELSEFAQLRNGNSTNQYQADEELQRLAEEEGWILDPDPKNIDEPLGKYD